MAEKRGRKRLHIEEFKDANGNELTYYERGLLKKYGVDTIEKVNEARKREKDLKILQRKPDSEYVKNKQREILKRLDPREAKRIGDELAKSSRKQKEKVERQGVLVAIEDIINGEFSDEEISGIGGNTRITPERADSNLPDSILRSERPAVKNREQVEAEIRELSGEDDENNLNDSDDFGDDDLIEDIDEVEDDLDENKHSKPSPYNGLVGEIDPIEAVMRTKSNKLPFESIDLDRKLGLDIPKEDLGTFEDTLDAEGDSLFFEHEEESSSDEELESEEEFDLTLNDILTEEEQQLYNQLEEDEELADELNLIYGDELKEQSYGKHLAETPYDKRMVEVAYTPRNYSQTLDDYRTGKVGYKLRLEKLEKMSKDDLLLILMRQHDTRRYQLGASFPCSCCGKFKPMPSFYAPSDEKRNCSFYEYTEHYLFTAIGHMPFCKKCMEKYFLRVWFKHHKNIYEAIYEMCRFLDVIFVPEWIATTYEKYFEEPMRKWRESPYQRKEDKPTGKDLFNKYFLKVSALNRKGAKGVKFLKGFEGALFICGLQEVPEQLKNHFDKKGNLIEVAEYDFSRFVNREMRRFWGKNFTDQEIYDLEEIHTSWKTRYEIGNKAMEDNIKLLTVLKYKMDKQISETGDFSYDDQKTYDNILKTSGLQPIQDNVKDGAGDSYGEWVKRIEKEEPAETEDKRLSDIDGFKEIVMFLKGHKHEMYDEFNPHQEVHQRVSERLDIDNYIHNEDDDEDEEETLDKLYSKEELAEANEDESDVDDGTMLEGESHAEE